MAAMAIDKLAVADLESGHCIIAGRDIYCGVALEVRSILYRQAGNLDIGRVHVEDGIRPGRLRRRATVKDRLALARANYSQTGGCNLNFGRNIKRFIVKGDCITFICIGNRKRQLGEVTYRGGTGGE